ncbi:MAG TPA: hypothetical protein DIT13_17825 [Verrucomicrobiales bacterium]|nr:hypothetical protein [Verrucomicrobiales bacterium]HRJ10119.1 hypothetical protein [Prosthecobacter sp.]HRK16007.1 hypothetical protein [Prosthecobacter sp.]
MQSPEPYLIFTRKLQELGLRHMVSGSVAAIYYGEPRLTNDVDIIVFLRREDARRIITAFPPDDFYCPPLEVIEAERVRDQRGHFNLIHHETGFKADIYLTGRDELHAWGFAHAVSADLDGDTVVFAPPEYVIVRKLQFFREGGSQKHLRDIHRMLLGLGDDWPRGTLMEMLRTHRLEPEWSLVKSWDE